MDATRQDNDTGDSRHLSGSHATKRPTYLLSGLLRCGCCGGTMNIGGSNPKRYYCANAREKGAAVCRGVPGIAQDKIEALVLNGLRDQLMQPEAVAEFIRRYQAHQRELDNDRRDRLSRIRSAMAATDKEIANILTAIKAGIFTSSTKAELETLEARKAQQQVDLASASTAAPTLPDDLAEIYQEKVEDLVTSLNDRTTRVQASEAIRALVDKVVVGWDGNGHTIELIGELAALLAMGTNGNAAGQLSAAALTSLKLVAGAYNHRQFTSRR